MNWKGEFLNAIGFAVLPALGALATWLAVRWPRLDRIDRTTWTRLLVAVWLVTRIGTHVAVFHVFRYSGGHDLLDIWVPIAEAVCAGQDPAPLIDNLYGPLFPHLLAFGWWITGQAYPPGIDLAFLLLDAGAVVLLVRIARRSFDESLARRLVLAVVCSPILWHGLVVRTQDEPAFLFFLLLVLDLLQRGRERTAWVAAALGTVFTKALFPLWVFPVLLAGGGGRRRTVVRVLASGALTVAALAAFHVAGRDLLGHRHGSLDVRGSSIWYLFVGDSQPAGAVFIAGLAVTALASVAAAFAALPCREDEDPGHAAARGTVAVQAAFFTVSPFTLPPHLVHALPFLAWQFVRRGGAGRPPTRLGLGLLACFAAWQVPSLGLASEYWQRYPVLIAAFTAWCAWTGWLALREPVDADPAQRRAA